MEAEENTGPEEPSPVPKKRRSARGHSEKGPIGVMVGDAQDSRLSDNGEPEQQGSQVDIPTQDLSIPAHRYGTRATNRDRHPGVEAGLAPASRDELRARADAKRAFIDAERKRRDHELAVQIAQLSEKRDALARLEDSRALAELELEDDFATVPDFGTPGEEVDMNACTRENKETQSPILISCSTISEGERVTGNAQTSQSDKGAFSFLGDEHSDSDSGQAAPESQHATSTQHPVTRGVVKASKKHLKVSAANGNTSEREEEEDASNDDDDDYQEEEEVDDEDEHSDEELSVTDDGLVDEAQSRKRKPSRSEEKARKQKAIRADLDARRLVPSSATARAKRPPSKAGAKDKASEKTPEKSDAFSIGWRRQLQERAQAARSLRKGISPVLLTPRSASKPPPAAKAMYKENLASHPNGYNSDTGGLSDGDVFADRHRVMSHKKKAKGKLRPELEFLDISSDTTEQAPGFSSLNKKSAPPGKKNAKLSNRSTEDSDSSLGYDALPTWVKPDIKTQVLPTLRELIGAQEDPWSLDTLERTFLDIVQEVFDVVFPERQYELKKGDRIYAWCQQQIYDWRRSFQKNANNAVRDEIAARRASATLSVFERSDHGLQAWLKDALARGGPAIYGKPNTADPRNAREQLGSKYVLKTMAAHLAGTVGSVASGSENAYPVGALALAAAAVSS
ncbi:hypothetical protein FKP32DRAFT_1671020 [Trametes sanguinea]|nr:hypothetical protein FKP32DRAFT_1671020 [Trametes sanguinea]